MDTDLTLLERLGDFAAAVGWGWVGIVLSIATAGVWEYLRSQTRKYPWLKPVVAKDNRHWIAFGIIIIGLLYASFTAFDNVNTKLHSQSEKPTIVTQVVTSPYEDNPWAQPTADQQLNFIRLASQAPSGTTFYTDTPQSACFSCDALNDRISTMLTGTKKWREMDVGAFAMVVKGTGIKIAIAESNRHLVSLTAAMFNSIGISPTINVVTDRTNVNTFNDSDPSVTITFLRKPKQ